MADLTRERSSCGWNVGGEGEHGLSSGQGSALIMKGL